MRPDRGDDDRVSTVGQKLATWLGGQLRSPEEVRDAVYLHRRGRGRQAEPVLAAARAGRRDRLCGRDRRLDRDRDRRHDHRSAGDADPGHRGGAGRRRAARAADLDADRAAGCAASWCCSAPPPRSCFPSSSRPSATARSRAACRRPGRSRRGRRDRARGLAGDRAARHRRHPARGRDRHLARAAAGRRGHHRGRRRVGLRARALLLFTTNVLAIVVVGGVLVLAPRPPARAARRSEDAPPPGVLRGRRGRRRGRARARPSRRSARSSCSSAKPPRAEVAQAWAERNGETFVVTRFQGDALMVLVEGNADGSDDDELLTLLEGAVPRGTPVEVNRVPGSASPAGRGALMDHPRRMRAHHPARAETAAMKGSVGAGRRRRGRSGRGSGARRAAVGRANAEPLGVSGAVGLGAQRARDDRGPGRAAAGVDRGRASGALPRAAPARRGRRPDMGPDRLPRRRTGRGDGCRASTSGRCASVRTALEIDRARLRARLRVHGRLVWSARIGVGAAGTPTPAGRFYVREKLRNHADPLYGPWAIGTSAYSALSDWPGGGVVGIHGTDRPDLISGAPVARLRAPHEPRRLRTGASPATGDAGMGALRVVAASFVAGLIVVPAADAQKRLVTYAARSCPTYARRDGEPRAQRHPGEPARPRPRHAVHERRADLPPPRSSRASRAAVRSPTGASSSARATRRKRSRARGGRCRSSPTPYDDIDRHQGLDAAAGPRWRPGRYRSPRRRDGRAHDRRRCSARRQGNSLWLQGGAVDDPVLDQIDPGQYGFAALRCAVDNLNGDNVKWIGYPNGVTHVLCYAYYVKPPPTSGDDRREQGPRRSCRHADQDFSFTGQHLVHGGHIVHALALDQRPAVLEKTFYRARPAQRRRGCSPRR